MACAKSYRTVSLQDKYNDFRQTHPVFVYESYQYDVQPDGLHIVFSFRIGDHIEFHPTAFFPRRPFLSFDQPRAVMESLVFNIGMAELVSYWKSYCPPRVEVRCGSLDEGQVRFWKKLYYHGLGEFFYVNGIQASEEDFMQIVSLGKPLPAGEGLTPLSQQNYIVPIGGGKDSVVTLELLQKALPQGVRPLPLIMNPRGATVGCAAAAGYATDEVLEIHRTIHPALLEANAAGCLNGHTPFSAMLAFYTLLASQLSGVANIALSNENSANESTVAGSSVNHQYSKSLDFENDFRRYVADYLPGGYNYFSFLRPLSELQIAMLFSREPKYFDVFRSCNVGSKQDIWCGHCAKCLFAYIILSPFIAPERLEAVFGKNMLDDAAMRPFFDQLAGHAATKPFECVGTVQEVHSALSMTLQRWYPAQRPCLLEDYRPAPPATPLHTLFPDHNLSPCEEALLREAVQ